MSLTKPLCYPGTNIFVIGIEELFPNNVSDNSAGMSYVNDNHSSSGLFLFNLQNEEIDSEESMDQMELTLVKDIYTTSGFVHDLNWVIPGKLVISTSGDGHIDFFNINFSSQPSLVNCYNTKISTCPIRQVSVDNFGARIATAGYERKLLISQISDSYCGVTPLTIFETNECIGSTRWHPKDHNLVSSTTDDGVWVLYDLRCNKKAIHHESQRSYNDQVSFLHPLFASLIANPWINTQLLSYRSIFQGYSLMNTWMHSISYLDLEMDIFNYLISGNRMLLVDGEKSK